MITYPQFITSTDPNDNAIIVTDFPLCHFEVLS